MAAWRGGRTLTWITGVVAFVASIGTAFTGYLSQSFFDSQWISSEAKDGIDSIGVGGWFNVLSPGQMLLWHVVLLPVVVGAITIWHVVRSDRTGSYLPSTQSAVSDMATAKQTQPAPPVHPRVHVTPDAHDFSTRRYDLVKEFVVALVVVALLTTALAAIFSSPDEKSITMSSWAKNDSANVVATAVGELAGITSSATYGAPYNTNSQGQSVLGIPLQKLGGVGAPVNSQDLVLQPLSQVNGNAQLSDAVATCRAAGTRQQAAWSNAYADALVKAPGGDPPRSQPGRMGPYRPWRPASCSLPAPVGSRARSRLRATSTGVTKPVRCCSSPTAPTRTRQRPSASGVTSGA